jgi:hypothetical protein
MLQPASALLRIARATVDSAGFVAGGVLVLLACGRDAPSDLPASSPASIAAARATPHEPNRTLQGDPPYATPQAAQSAQGIAQAGQYVCPMHPHVHSDHPGRCPECGMSLVRQASDKPGQTGDER